MTTPIIQTEYDGYTHILLKQIEMKNSMEHLQIQMDFLLMNIRKGNFNSQAEADHAIVELCYLINAAENVSAQASELKGLAIQLKDRLAARDYRAI
ncbi:hypothetical protein M2277_005048 [Paenibacillus sp. LBL]|uniref:hypothetical protein n=1 Tax=Paenibacillus sp. LBL TaxID=2940563 RepID=UPI002473A9DD|nr:hypothetical protein [Paenibacillus sp. LBL]MDH6674356.1 hypothetical protein [Paenibacillus sp. LBL]